MWYLKETVSTPLKTGELR
jgi:hypothetical protein